MACELMDNVDNDEEEQKVDDEEDVLGTVSLARKSKLALKDTELYTYFCNRLERMSCPLDHAVALQLCMI